MYHRAVGFLDYYRQFEATSEEEINEGRRAKAAERRRKALVHVETLDVSRSTWSGLPDHSVANAVTYIARRGMPTYPSTRRSELRHELAEDGVRSAGPRGPAAPPGQTIRPSRGRRVGRLRAS